MKKYSMCVILIIVPLVMAMGSGFDGDSPEKIPIPTEKFSATYIDQMDVITECTGVSINGKTFLEGSKGEGTYTIAFKEIKHIDFLQKGGTLTGVVTMTNDERVELEIHKDHKAYGKTKYGTFQITLAKLKTMTLHH